MISILMGDTAMEPKGLADTIEMLKSLGYVEDFNLEENISADRKSKFEQFADEYRIDAVYRFDEMSDPSDQSVLYAMHSVRTGKKGTLLNSFGIYTEASTDEMIEALQVEEKSAPKIHGPHKSTAA